jgi:glycerophosphoryl diester phosphodiesterase
MTDVSAAPATARKDPIFGRPTPLLFAHRGGVCEAPQSTEKAFRFALDEAHADVLELDVQVTLDHRIVVWHGPELDDVLIDGRPTRPAERARTDRRITSYRWMELAGHAWVADPAPPGPRDLAAVPRDPDRRLLLLEEMLALFPAAPINIELKESIEKRHLAPLLDILDAHQKRPILVVATSGGVLREFRKLARGRYATGCSALEAATFALPRPTGDLTGRALQTSYWGPFATRSVVRRVREAGGATHVFLTEFWPARALDGGDPPDRPALLEILDRGVDGVMTDRPRAVRTIIDEWRIAHS